MLTENDNIRAEQVISVEHAMVLALAHAAVVRRSVATDAAGDGQHVLRAPMLHVAIVVEDAPLL